MPAMVLSPLLFVKVPIARYSKNQRGLLMPIGLTVFVLAFVLIAGRLGEFAAEYEAAFKRVTNHNGGRNLEPHRFR